MSHATFIFPISFFGLQQTLNSDLDTVFFQLLTQLSTTSLYTMKVLLLFGLLLLALAYAQDADCPFDPCSRDLPSNCTYSKCIHLGQCIRVFVNEAGAKVCLDESDTTSNCPSLDTCYSYCSYGYATDEETGCLKCECREPMECKDVVCVELQCEDPSRTMIPTGLCCPTCLPACYRYNPCKVEECGTEEIDVSTAFDCCPVCVPKSTCDDVECPDVECSDGEREVKVGCCPVCVAKLDCSLITCPDLSDCTTGILYSENSCCPKCALADPCEGIDSCPKLNCTEGQKPVRVDGECCEVCRSDDYCDKVSCPQYSGDCPTDDEDFMIQRDGTCCPYCPTCRDTERTRCDRNDRSVCAPGYFRGADCAEEIPASERLEIRIEITVSGLSLEASDIKTFIANKLKIDPVYITVTKNGDVYTVIISDDAANPTLDFGTLQGQVDQVIASSSFMKKNESSGAVQLVTAAVLSAVCLAMAL